MSYELTKEQARVPWQLKLFDESDEDYIWKEVARKLYDPELPCGGDKERKIVERLKKMALDREWERGAVARRWPRKNGKRCCRKMSAMPGGITRKMR